MAKKITATTAAKHFRDVLNQVEYNGETFQVERHGKVIAEIRPVEAATVRGTPWSEVRDFFLNGPRPDPEFAADMEEILRSIPKELPPDPWERS